MMRKTMDICLDFDRHNTTVIKLLTYLSNIKKHRIIKVYVRRPEWGIYSILKPIVSQKHLCTIDLDRMYITYEKQDDDFSNLSEHNGHFNFEKEIIILNKSCWHKEYTKYHGYICLICHKEHITYTNIRHDTRWDPKNSGYRCYGCWSRLLLYKLNMIEMIVDYIIKILGTET